MITVLAWIATGCILTTYALMQAGKPAKWFNYANAFGAAPLVASSAITGGWPAATVSAAFGLIAWFGFWKGWRQRRRIRKRLNSGKPIIKYVYPPITISGPEFPHENRR